MDSKKMVLPAFILIALMQLAVPAKMIWDREEIMETGTEYRFKTAPIDPNDPFRGKYITLSYNEDTIAVENEADWTRGEEIYVSLTTDDAGFAKPKSVLKEKPTDQRDFLRAKVRFVSGNSPNELTIDYPFDRFYMEESKAPEAEQTYRRTEMDTSKTAYALVSIKNGEAVLKDVLIDGTPIGELVNANQE